MTAILHLAGLAAFFLWGLHMVQSGLRRALGERLNHFVRRHTQGRLRAFFAGALAAGLLQSSTAASMIAAGFAAEGSLGLAAGLALTLGANLGSSLLVQLFALNPELLAPPLILIGYLLFRRATPTTKACGRALIGLGLIFVALHQLGALFAPLASGGAADPVFALLSGQLLLLALAGVLLAAAAHSSLAAVLVTMGLAAHGLLPLADCIAIVAGANVGAAVNPVLAFRARGREALRLPAGNLALRALGAAALLIFLAERGSAASLVGLPAGDAVMLAHCAFNLAVALVGLAFAGPIARLLVRCLRDANAGADPHAPRYLLTDPAPASASLRLHGAARETLRQVDILDAMLASLGRALTQPPSAAANGELEERLDRLTHAIRDNLLAVDAAALDPAGRQRLRRILHFSTHLEQAGDIAEENLLRKISRRSRRGIATTDADAALLGEQVGHLRRTLQASAALFLSGDAAAARELTLEKARFRRMEGDAIEAHFMGLGKGDRCSSDDGGLLLDALRDLKRINAHLVEASAYPILEAGGQLRETRLRAVGDTGSQPATAVGA